MSEIKFSNFINEDGSNGPDLVGVTTFTSPYYFVPPSGTTAQRPSGDGLAPGTLRFNTDIGRLEVWRGDHWATILGESPNLNGGARGIFSGGASPAPTTNVLDYVTISTLGNATDFGDLTGVTSYTGAFSSSTRGVWAGGYYNNTMSYVTISSTGNSQDFGDLTGGGYTTAGFSSSTRGIIASGAFPSTGPRASNTIDYVTIASTGNAVDFGDLTVGRNNCAGCSSSTRGIVIGGSGATNTIDYVTIASTGNATDFGDTTQAFQYFQGCSNSTRGVFGGGYNKKAIEFLTIASTGNSQSFGDLLTNTYFPSACSSSTRGLFGGGNSPPSNSNVIQYVTILSTGNAVDFGDLNYSSGFTGALSNGHGGL